MLSKKYGFKLSVIWVFCCANAVISCDSEPSIPEMLKQYRIYQTCSGDNSDEIKNRARSAVLAELKKRTHTQRDATTFFASWHTSTSPIMNKEKWEKSLNCQKAFFEWLYRNTEHLGLPNTIVTDAVNLFMTCAESCHQLQPWGHREYPTPLDNLPKPRSKYLDLLAGLICNSMLERHENTPTQLFHFAFKGLQLVTDSRSKLIPSMSTHPLLASIPQWIYSIVEKDPKSFQGAELATYYLEGINPKTALASYAITKYNVANGRDPASIMVITTPQSRRSPQGSLLPELLDVLIGETSPQNEIDKQQQALTKYSSTEWKILAANGGRLNGNYGTIPNAAFIASQIVANDPFSGEARRYIKRTLLNVDSYGEELALMYFSDHVLDPVATPEAIKEEISQDFMNAFTTFSRQKASKHRSGPKQHKEKSDLELTPTDAATSSSPASTWKEAERASREASGDTVPRADVKLFFSHGSGSRVHFIICDNQEKELAAFTRHIDHSDLSNLDRYVGKNRAELMSFGLQLRELQNS